MGLLSGSVSITRYNVISMPQELDFETARFFEVQAGSEVRISKGFIPMEPGADYEFGHKRWAFRVRIDQVRPDPTMVRERFRELVRVELDAGAEFVGPKKRKELRILADEEILVVTSPTSRIIEAAIDGKVLYVASTANNQLGIVLEQLRRVGIEAEPKAPWTDGQTPEYTSDIFETHEPGESALGCRFLKDLVGDMELAVEPEAGYVKLMTSDTKVTISGGVLHDLLHFIETDAELLSAKVTTGETSFRFEAASYRLSNLRIETERHNHWTDLLDERIEKISDIFDLLDAKFDDLLAQLS
jgi:hypothetical protein